MWGAGFASGIGVGFAIGLITGTLTSRQKPWSEMTDKEKRIRKISIGVGLVLLLLGVGAFTWILLTR